MFIKSKGIVADKPKQYRKRLVERKKKAVIPDDGKIRGEVLEDEEPIFDIGLPPVIEVVREQIQYHLQKVVDKPEPSATVDVVTEMVEVPVKKKKGRRVKQQKKTQE